jgi:hypothetical protein
MASVEMATSMMPVLVSRKRPQENKQMPQSLKKTQVLNDEKSVCASATTDKENDQNAQSKKLVVLDTRNSVCASAITDRMRDLFPKYQLINLTGEVMSIVSSWRRMSRISIH